MRTGRPTPSLKITALEREALEGWARGNDRRLATRAAVILAAADGVSNKDMASRCSMTKQTVGKWRARFCTNRMQGLYDDPRPGAPRRITDNHVARVIRLTSERAPNGSAWTTRSLARAVGLTQTAISRIWRTYGVRPAPANGGSHRPDGRSSAAATPLPPERAAPEEDAPARARTLAAIHNLLRDARALRGTCAPELDPLLGLAIDAIERALAWQRERSRSSYARADMALRNARNLLDRAEVATRAVQSRLADRESAATAAAAIRSVADRLAARAAQAASPSPPRAHSLRRR